MKLNHFQPRSFTQHPAECKERQSVDTRRWSSTGRHVLPEAADEAGGRPDSSH